MDRILNKDTVTLKTEWKKAEKHRPFLPLAKKTAPQSPILPSATFFVHLDDYR
jgi:hypothetical protein